MADRISADLAAMGDAVQGIQDALDQVTGLDLAAMEPGSGEVGHDGLADRLGEFCRRWDIGVENLRGDGEELASRLQQAAEAFAVDEAARTRASQGLFR